MSVINFPQSHLRAPGPRQVNLNFTSLITWCTKREECYLPTPPQDGPWGSHGLVCGQCMWNVCESPKPGNNCKKSYKCLILQKALYKYCAFCYSHLNFPPPVNGWWKSGNMDKKTKFEEKIKSPTENRHKQPNPQTHGEPSWTLIRDFNSSKRLMHIQTNPLIVRTGKLGLRDELMCPFHPLHKRAKSTTQVSRLLVSCLCPPHSRSYDFPLGFFLPQYFPHVLAST